ncbi:trehalase [Burkholderia pseudomallei]|nr:trehalase [Burkholderia pseudomallei]
MTAVFHRRGSALRAGVHAMPKKHRAARSAGLRGIGTKRPRRRPTRPAAGHRLRRAVPARRAGAAAPASPGAAPSIAQRRAGAARGRGRAGFPGGRAPRARRRVRGAPHAAAHGHLREVWEEPLA